MLLRRGQRGSNRLLRLPSRIRNRFALRVRALLTLPSRFFNQLLSRINSSADLRLRLLSRGAQARSRLFHLLLRLVDSRADLRVGFFGRGAQPRRCFLGLLAERSQRLGSRSKLLLMRVALPMAFFRKLARQPASDFLKLRREPLRQFLLQQCAGRFVRRSASRCSFFLNLVDRGRQLLRQLFVAFRNLVGPSAPP